MIDINKQLTPLEALNLYNLETIIQEKRMDYLWEFQPRSSMIELYNNLCEAAKGTLPEDIEDRDITAQEFVGVYLEERAREFCDDYELPSVADTDPSPLTKEQRENTNGPWKDKEEREAIEEQKRYTERLNSLKTEMLQDIENRLYFGVDKDFGLYKSKWEEKYHDNAYLYDKTIDLDTDKAPRTYTYKKKMLLGHIFEQQLTKELGVKDLSQQMDRSIVDTYVNIAKLLAEKQNIKSIECNIQNFQDSKISFTTETMSGVKSTFLSITNILANKNDKNILIPLEYKDGTPTVLDTNAKFVICTNVASNKTWDPQTQSYAKDTSYMFAIKTLQSYIKNVAFDNGVMKAATRETDVSWNNKTNKVLEGLDGTKYILLPVEELRQKSILKEHNIFTSEHEPDIKAAAHSMCANMLMSNQKKIEREIKTEQVDKKPVKQEQHSTQQTEKPNKPFVWAEHQEKFGNFQIVELTDEEVKKAKQFSIDIENEKLNVQKETHFRRDSRTLEGRFYTGILGEMAVLKFMGFGAEKADMALGNAKDFAVPDLRGVGLKVGVKTVRQFNNYGERSTQLVNDNLNEPQIFCEKIDDHHIAICGYLDNKTILENSSKIYVNDKNAAGRKSGFYGLDKLQYIWQAIKPESLQDREAAAIYQNNIDDYKMRWFAKDIDYARFNDETFKNIPETVDKMEIKGPSFDIPENANLVNLSNNDCMIVGWVQDNTLYIKTSRYEIGKMEMQDLVDSVYQNTQIKQIKNTLEAFRGVDFDKASRLSLSHERYGFIDNSPEHMEVNEGLGDHFDEMVEMVEKSEELNIPKEEPLFIDEKMAEKYFSICHSISNKGDNVKSADEFVK